MMARRCGLTTRTSARLHQSRLAGMLALLQTGEVAVLVVQCCCLATLHSVPRIILSLSKGTVIVVLRLQSVLFSGTTRIIKLMLDQFWLGFAL